jgi:hypothetical protein
MKFLRKRLVQRTISIFLLLVFLQSLVAPEVAHALTSGPHQQEYASYEEPGGSDMVNLLTGDFNFNLPVLEVPGPEGSFPVPLSYSAGVGLEQESSWVGLGWSMNAGAITRTINEFPDDATGQSQSVTVQDLTGARGWSMKMLGIGKFGWNTNVGHYGNLSLLSIVNAEWTENYTSVGLMGVNVTSDGVKANGMQIGMAIISVVSLGAGAAAANGGKILATEVVKQASIGMATGAIMDGAMSLTSSSEKTPKGPNGYWAYNNDTRRRGLLGAVYKDYKIWLDKSRVENMYGALYLGNAPTEVWTHPSSDYNLLLGVKNIGTTETLRSFKKSSSTTNEGAASDINYRPDWNESWKEFYETNNPVVLGYDNFHVKGAGISGAITPYRLEVGSVSMPREMSSNHQRYAPVRYLTNDGTAGSYKVPFVYEGKVSNSYYHHLGSNTAVTSPAFYFGVSTELQQESQFTNKRLNYLLNDVILKNERIKTSLSTIKKIPQANSVEWLSNAEIGSSVTYSSKFMDFLSPGSGAAVAVGSDRHTFRNTPSIGSLMTFSESSSFNYSAVPVNSADINLIAVNDVVDFAITYYNSSADFHAGIVAGSMDVNGITVTGKTSSTIAVGFNSGFAAATGKYVEINIRIRKSMQPSTMIGGFCITAPDGTTYHYALPSFDYEHQSEIRDVADPNNKKSSIRRNAAFANTWMLTGITGSDFIDRNANGIIDDGDWGHWVKMNYGLHHTDYEWKIPYSNTATPDYQLVSPLQESYSKGKKQMIFLNSIETRSHVALFVKSQRLDGRSARADVVQLPLKLDEIALLSKENYNKLIKPTNQGGYGVTDFSNKINVVLQGSSFSTDARTFINNNCDKRVVFSYDYALCKNTLNSTASGGGKLTLNRVSVRGRNDLKIVPDYKFEYAFNPDYDKNKFDTWGMYNSAGTTSFSSHNPSQNQMDATAWALTKVITPLGAELEVNYERDDYSWVSGQKTMEQTSSFSVLNKQFHAPTYVPITRVYVNNTSSYSVGEEVYVAGTINYYCPTGGMQTKNFASYFTIQSIGNDPAGNPSLNLGVDYTGAGNCGGLSSGQYILAEGLTGTVSKVMIKRIAGDLRVGSIATKDEFGNQNKIRYLYKDDQGFSSGAVSKVPGGYANYYDYPGYPDTPVMYGKVSVLTGKLTNDSDYHTRQEFEFEMPHYSQITMTNNVISNMAHINTYNSDFKDFLSVYENQLVDRTSKIGRMKSMRIYNGSGTERTASTFQYSDELGDQILNDGVNNYQGVYANSVLMFDRVKKGNSNLEKVHKINRTSLIKYPSALVKVTNTKDGFTSETVNKNWDFLTGMVLEKQTKTSLGVYFKSIVKPAYKQTEYSEMGSKTENPANRNMLTQIAAEYVYRTDAVGNTVGLVQASAQTWSKNWTNYRYHNGTTYVESPEEPTSAVYPVWRTKASYYFKGNYSDYNQATGTTTIPSGQDFVFSNPSASPLWQINGEVKRYDHYSMPLESVDMSGKIFSSVKLGYDGKIMIAKALNAKYNETAFSSAEDEIPGINYFGAEVAKKDASGNATVVRKSAGADSHTGDCALSLSTGYGFVYKSTDLTTNKKYKAVVWTNSVNGRIYYKLNGGAEQLSAAPSNDKKVGNWYRIELPINTGGATSIEVGVKSASGTVLFDDFRFQPQDAVMTCFVTDPLDATYSPGQTRFEYSLDNNNLFSKVEYDEKGNLIKTYNESFTYGVKLVSETRQNFRRSTINP